MSSQPQPWPVSHGKSKVAPKKKLHREERPKGCKSSVLTPTSPRHSLIGRQPCQSVFLSKTLYFSSSRPMESVPYGSLLLSPG